MSHAPGLRDSRVWSSGICVALIAYFLVMPTLRKPVAATDAPPRLESGEQLVAVVISAEFCAATQQDSTRARIGELLVALDSIATVQGLDFTTIGVAVDPDALTGARFLEGLFNFDEVMAGNNWQSAGAMRYMWRDFPGEASIPQIVVIRRSLVVDTAVMSVAIENERVIGRIVGANQLAAFTVEALDVDMPR